MNKENRKKIELLIQKFIKNVENGCPCKLRYDKGEVILYPIYLKHPKFWQTEMGNVKIKESVGQGGQNVEA